MTIEFYFGLFMNNINFKKCCLILIKTLRCIFKYSFVAILFLMSRSKKKVSQENDVEEEHLETLRTVYKIHVP